MFKILTPALLHLMPLYVNSQIVFLEPPDNFNPKIEVAACFIKVSDEVLFLKRLPHKSEGNTWGIPGGKLNHGESAENAVIREVVEETGIHLQNQALKYFGKVYIRYPQVDFIYHMFEYTLDRIPDVALCQEEHSEFRWLALKEALKLPLIPGEDECIYLCYTQNK